MNIDTSKLNIGELELIQTQYNGDLGSFKKALWVAIMHADLANLARLEQGFPEQVIAFRKFGHEPGYWVDVLTRAGLVAPQPATPPAPGHQPIVMPREGKH